VTNVTSYLVTFIRTLQTCISFILFSTCRLILNAFIAVYRIKTNAAFLEGRLLSSQSEQSEKFQKYLIGWKKADPPKKPLLFDHINRLLIDELLL